ncbi:MAG: NAD(P)-binding domain-containing protein [Oscillospiraceae bacterium]|nr:NAD(P)-binding domain-containing protein [Oscillospiraceae bacterium]
MQKKPKILIYGAGAIGSIYAVELSKAGYDVTVYARGSRLQALQSQGLLYRDRGTVKKASVSITEKVHATDLYDYIFVTVRYEQIEAALTELAENASKTIVTMVNNPDGYAHWERIVGAGRILPAFAGAGGVIEDGVLQYQLTPKIVQPTTFGEINGERSERVRNLAALFKASKVPYSISKNMDAWQKSHIAMVVSLASGFYFDGGDNYTTAKNKEALRMSSRSAKESFQALKRIGVPITPPKLHVFRLCPLWLMDLALKLIFNTKFAETVMAAHALIAKDEMRLLGEKLDELIGKQPEAIQIEKDK